MLAAAAVLSLSFCTMAETSPVQAIDIGTIGTIAQAGAYYAQLNQQLNYLDNEGPRRLYEADKSQVWRQY